MKKIVAVSILVLGLAGCTAREQQLVTAGVVGALAGAVVVNRVSEPYQYPYYRPSRAYNPYVYHIPRRQHCYIVDYRTQYGIRRERVCR